MPTIIGEISNIQNRPLLNVAERLRGKNEMYRRMLDAYAEKHRGAMPAKVVSFNASKQTIVAQPLIREKVIDRATGSVQWMTLPQLLDVPVQFPQAGSFALTMPIQAGDEVLLIFNDMCIDGWWNSGGVQNWNVRRRHDLSDAIAIPGINSRPNAIQNIASNGSELKSKDGEMVIGIYRNELAGVKTDIIQLSSGDANITLTRKYSVIAGVATEISNQIDLNATTININGDLKHNGFNYLHHVHPTPSGTSGTVTEVP